MELSSPLYLAWEWRIALDRSLSMPRLLLFLPPLSSDNSNLGHHWIVTGLIYVFFFFLFSIFTLINFFLILRKYSSDFWQKFLTLCLLYLHYHEWEDRSWTCLFFFFFLPLEILILLALISSWTFALLQYMFAWDSFPLQILCLSLCEEHTSIFSRLVLQN